MVLVTFGCGHTFDFTDPSDIIHLYLYDLAEHYARVNMLSNFFEAVPVTDAQWAAKRTEERMYAPMDIQEKVRKWCRWQHPCGTGTLNTGPYTDYEYRFLLYVSVATSIIDFYLEGQQVADNRLRVNVSRLGYGVWKTSLFNFWRHQIKHMIALSDKSHRAGLGHRAMESIYFAKLSINAMESIGECSEEMEQLLMATAKPGDEIHAELPLYIPFYVQCWRPNVNFDLICWLLGTNLYDQAAVERFCYHVGHQIGPNAPPLSVQGLRPEELPRSKTRDYYDAVRHSCKKKPGLWD